VKTCVEICAGAGGQSIGLERAGFEPEVLVEIKQRACETLSLNRPGWNVHHGDLHDFSAEPYVGIDLVSGGVPCPPFSIAGRQLGADDERDLFPSALRIVAEAKPQAVMLENVKGHELQETKISYQPCADKPNGFEQLCSGFWEQ